MSHEETIKFMEMQKEIEEEQRYPMTPNELTDEKRKQFSIEEDLMILGSTFARLLSKGVDRKIISDTLINASEIRDITELCSEFDSFLRQVKF
jgi:hypothetical protein